jgi:2'-5' RNA ligase
LQLYAMLKPPMPVRRQIAGYRVRYGFDESYAVDRFHNTLFPLGSADIWDEPALELLSRYLGMAECDPFEMAFDQIDGTVLRASSRMRTPAQFQRMLRRRAEMCGIPLPPYTFDPHLTLAYKGVRLAGVRKIPPISWRVEDFLLVRSGDGKHEELGRWPLVRRQYTLPL